MATPTAELFFYAFLLFLSYFALVAVYYLVLAAIGFFEERQKAFEEETEGYETITTSSFTSPVSIIIPAHNEEKMILNCVESVINLKYPKFEIIIVDDGSDDKTLDLLKEKLSLTSSDRTFSDRFHTGRIREFFKSEKYPHVNVLSKSGRFKKAGAINIGITFAKYRYVCTMDADTILEPDALLKVMVQIEKNPEKIIGAGSYFGLSNGFKIEEGKIIERSFSYRPIIAYQNLEYIRSFIGNRMAWSRWNALPIISGGFGIWRRDIIIENGGYAPEFSSEDMEFSFRVRDFIVKNKEKKYQIIMLPYYVGWTNGPTNVKALLLQRSRWQRTANESIFLYKHMLFNPQHGIFGFLTFPYFFFYESLGVFFETASIIFVIIGWLSNLLNIKTFLVIIIAMILTQALISLVTLLSYIRDQRSMKPLYIVYLAFLSFFEFFWYRIIISIARLQGTLGYFRRIKTHDQFVR
ncbi:MAG: glycosyltransferase family 2 protein [Candidatus Omnitrophota bacterium]